jgi:hypothetical protein
VVHNALSMTPNASAALKLISATWSLWIPFLAGFRFCLFRLYFANGLGSNLFRSTKIWRCRTEILLLCLRRVVY